MPRFSSTSSWTIRGIWNSIRLANAFLSGGRAGALAAVLLRVVLDDQLLLDGRVYLDPVGQLQDLAGQPLVGGLEPGGDGGGQVGRVANRLLRRGSGLDGDDVVRLDLEARDVHAAPVDEEVAVANELARLRARRREAEAV